MTPKRSIVFIGFMGAGKSGAARIAAEQRGEPSIDTDRLIEKAVGLSSQEFFDASGEEVFREREAELVGELLEHASDEVISLGGGSVLSERVREALKDHLVVLLDVDLDVAWQRASGKGRPLARDRETFDRVYHERRELYYELADVVVPRGGRDAARQLLPVLERFKAAPSGSRMIWATSRSGNYPVYFGDRQLLADCLARKSDRKQFFVTDRNVFACCGERFPGDSNPILIEAGEESKTLSTAARVWSELASRGATRSDVVLAFGGGVVGDLAGFCAATYQRGIDVIQIPTTVVAQVDSAYGGKTGVDLPEAKNYVGAYHQPAAVIVDPSLLETLPQEERAAGYAEVVKTALIAGGPLWDRISVGGPVDEQTIFECALTKLQIVAQDERDGGRRQVLNLGHTIGHAIETVTGYGRYRHGEAVGLGLLAALSLSNQPELRQRVSGLLSSAGLPTRLDAGFDVDATIEAIQKDKKRVGAKVPFVTVRVPGDVQFGAELEDDAVRSAIEGLT